MIKIIFSSLILFIFSISFFTFLYYYYNKNLIYSFYDSVMIQTLVGVDRPKSDFIKLAMSIQAIISYLITSGVIIFTINYFD